MPHLMELKDAGKFTLCDAPSDQQHNVSNLQSDPEKSDDEKLLHNYNAAKNCLSLCTADDEKLLHNYNAAKNCLSLCTGFVSTSCQPCEEGWTAHRGKCYFFSSKKQTWFESRDLCVASKARLVSISNKEIQDFLVSKIKETHWIGLNDLETEGHWVWMNSQTLSETGVQFWHMRVSWPNEPDNWKEDDPSGENCASLGNFDGFLNEWFDNSCRMQKKFICEKKNTFPLIDDI
ncbi:CD209 antigen-like protein C [Sinocyclocheilus anshuiensis]|uniref:CD209 antigen-like protein C n=1 Tax=Sinocyclocheilus anshuiensis TaxID=1608454 RepID=UPI0007B93280|nr:PREDICTED: CD209 antigen-like protein C [Sinocyclocheilus anshuiensis]